MKAAPTFAALSDPILIASFARAEGTMRARVRSRHHPAFIMMPPPCALPSTRSLCRLVGDGGDFDVFGSVGAAGTRLRPPDRDMRTFLDEIGRARLHRR